MTPSIPDRGPRLPAAHRQACLPAAQRQACAVLFTDICNSMGLKEQLGEERFDVLRREYTHECIRAAHKGAVLKDTGDGLLVAFQSPSDAVEAALAMRDATGLALHFGIDFGELISEPGDVHGGVADRAARINSAAGAGQILVSDAVFRSAKGFADHRLTSWYDHGERELRGVEAPVHLWEPYNANIGIRRPMNSSTKIVTAHLVIEALLLVLIIIAFSGLWNLSLKGERLAFVETRISESNARLDRIEALLRRP